MEADLKHFQLLFGSSGKHTHIVVAINRASMNNSENWTHIDTNKLRKTLGEHEIIVSSWFTDGAPKRLDMQSENGT